MDYKAIPNLAEMFYRQADKLGDKPFLWAKSGGEYVATSWSEAREGALNLARGLASLGVEAGDRVVIVSENRPEWAIADLAVMTLGAISVPAYTTNTTDDHLYILDHAEAKAAIVSTRRLAHRLLPAARSSTSCQAVVTMEEPEGDTQAGISVYGWFDLCRRDGPSDKELRAKAADLKRDDVSCFIYTSGTGGRPKGVMLTHGSMLANCLGAYDLLMEIGLEDEVFLSLLPLSHSYEHTCGLFFPISIGAQIYYCEGPDKVSQNLSEARPTIMTAVPRLYEVLHDRIRRGVDSAGGVKAKLFHRAVELGRRKYENKGKLGLVDGIENIALDKLVRKKVAGRFGGRLKAFVSGGAALNEEIGKFFIALGIRLLQGYGQTEASPVISANRCFNVKIHTVGPPLIDVNVKIADDGEILVAGELLMKGYWREPDLTAKTIVNGWLHTGDIGVIDEDGYIQITDRKKDIIVNSGGDNISPARVEGYLTVEPELAQVMAYGDKRPYLVAVVVPTEEFMADFAKEHGKEASLGALKDDETFVKAISTSIDKVNGGLSNIEKVRRFTIADEAFTTDNHMMTPTLKIRRHKVREAYWERLDALYGKG